MADYSELQNPGGEDTLQDTEPNAQENFAMYDPGPQEATDENWESWHGDEVSFSRTSTDGGGRGCYNCACCTCVGGHVKSRRYIYLVFLCSSILLCILAAVIASVIFGTISTRSSPTLDGYWYESAVGYQIFTRSFQDSDGDGVGDFKGIINRLDYLQYLGVDVIWLCSINTSPGTDGVGLDVTNFTEIDPILGTFEDFQNLIKAAHQKDIKLVLEFVPNQSSEDHVWFEQSRQSKTNPYGDFYIWADGIRESEPPNDWKDASGNPSWVYESSRQQWYHHSFLDTEPSLNYDNQNIKTAMRDVLHFWMGQGIDGLYIRNVNHLLGTSEVETDQSEFDDPVTLNYTRTGRSRRASESASFGSSQRAKLIIKEWLTIIQEFERSKSDKKLLVVDTYRSPMTYTTSMYGTKEEPLADYPFNYALFDIHKRKITGHNIRYLVEQCLINRPPDTPINWGFGSPQISRLTTRYEPRFVGAVTLLTLALPGSPLLYYGDEIGMTDTMDTNLQEAVPYAPMQWDSTQNAGFTDGDEPWIDLANNSLTNNVQTQRENQSSLLNLIRSAIKLRHAQPSLNDPSEKVHLYDLHSMRELLVFVRHHKNGNFPGFLFVANVANDYDVTEDYTLLVKSLRLPDTGTVVLATNYTLIGETVDLKKLKLCSGDAVIVEFKITEDPF